MKTVQSDRDYFNERAEDWDTLCVHDQKKVKYIIEKLELVNGQSLLDVGTGTGVLIPHLFTKLGKEGKIVAVDVSEKMLEVARSKFCYENIEYIHGDVLEGVIQDSFDVIVCYSMFPHFKDKKEDAIGLLSQMLKRGGKLCIAHSQSRQAINQLHHEAGKNVKHDRLPKMDELKSWFYKNGMEVIVEEDSDEYFMLIGQSTGEVK